MTTHSKNISIHFNRLPLRPTRQQTSEEWPSVTTKKSWRLRRSTDANGETVSSRFGEERQTKRYAKVCNKSVCRIILRIVQKDKRFHGLHNELWFQFDWLKNHFRTKHVPKAQPLKCLMNGCPIRFQNEKALNAHLLNSHDDKPGRQLNSCTNLINCNELSKKLVFFF